MLDQKLIRENPTFVEENLSLRGKDYKISHIHELTVKKKEIDIEISSHQSESKKLSKLIAQEIGKSQNNNSPEINNLKKKGNDYRTKISEFEEKQRILDKQIYNEICNLPNFPSKDAPIGKDEGNNVEVKTWGDPLVSENLKSHWEIGESLNLFDSVKSTKISKSRFITLIGNGARLERALINFMLDIHTTEFKYTEISPPLIVNEDVMFGTGQLPKFEEDQFQIKFDNIDQRKFLIPTAEVVLTNLARDSLFKKEELPLRFVASTPCFRKEAGSYGKDTKGMIRQHQFYKVELVSIVEPKNCNSELQRMLNCAKSILEKLEIPHQVVLLSSGDMGFSAEKTYDIEVWIPSEKKYREISSCSSCGSFQARRMGAKLKSGNGKEFVGTLNGSGLAVGRLIIALLENNQNKDGSVTIPNVLKKYMNNLDKI